MPSFLWSLIPLAILGITVAVVIARARRRTKEKRPAREPSAFVVLEANLWEACVVDDLREPVGSEREVVYTAAMQPGGSRTLGAGDRGTER